MTDPIAQLQERGFCILKQHFARQLIDDARDAFWPALLEYVATHRDAPNRGPDRHCVPLLFEPPGFIPEFFFDPNVLSIVRGVLDDRIVADQWHCDVALPGSTHQGIHVDYQRPLFAEAPELPVPPYMLLVSFGLNRIALQNGPIEIAPGTHRLPRAAALRAAELGEIEMQPVTLQTGDVLIRHPWALHRGSPNTTEDPRALASIRYVRRWYWDDSREVSSIPYGLWDSFAPEQQALLRFPVQRHGVGR